MQGVIVEAPERLVGEIVDCRIVRVGAHSLHGEVAVARHEVPAKRICA
jgi:hypothetical protein